MPQHDKYRSLVGLMELLCRSEWRTKGEESVGIVMRIGKYGSSLRDVGKSVYYYNYHRSLDSAIASGIKSIGGEEYHERLH